MANGKNVSTMQPETLIAGAISHIKKRHHDVSLASLRSMPVLCNFLYKCLKITKSLFVVFTFSSLI